MKRIFLIVLDSVGAGEAPDAADFGDVGAHTLWSQRLCMRLRSDNREFRRPLSNVAYLQA